MAVPQWRYVFVFEREHRWHAADAGTFFSTYINQPFTLASASTFVKQAVR
jgi:hypothetical protein